MKILLIAPASGKWRNIGRAPVFNGRTFRFSLLSLLSVAAETPPDIEVQIIDEQIERIPWDEPVDLVGITCMTAAAPRAYEIAAQFRKRGVPVVLGGMHPSLCAEEAVLHAEAVVAGDAEGLWPRVIEEVCAGRSRGIYRNPTPPVLGALRRPPRHLLRQRGYAPLDAVQATRGCPHGCEFCSVAAYHRRIHRQRPVGEVADEIAGLPGRFFVFADDNLIADRAYARSHFAALRPLGKRWITQASVDMADDDAFVRLAAEAGCVGIFLGIETFSAANLDAVRKTCNHVDRYRAAIRRLHAHGIGVEAGIVLGFPHDQPDVFERTLRFLDELEVDVVLPSILTPLPGTPLFAQMDQRILDRDWTHYDFDHAVFRHPNMSTEDLEAGQAWLTREFYRPWRIARRVWRQLWRPRPFAALPFMAVVNAAFYGRVVRWHLRGWNPAREATGGPVVAGQFARHRAI
jgi:radical SAM superfamily enzyme YgiQ (UPF0313 family)